MAYSQELESLISDILVDGVVTEKERSVLHKKAQQEGIDPDEIDIVLDARLEKVTEVKTKEKIAKEKEKAKGRKCPFCGEDLESDVTSICPSCGRVIDNTTQENKALKEYIDNLEAALVELKEDGPSYFDHETRARLESMIRQGKSMYGDNKQIKYLIGEIEYSIEQFESEYKKKKRNHRILVGIILLIPILWFAKCQFNSSKVSKIAEHQCDSLCTMIKSLETADEYNYREVETDLYEIIWTDIPGDHSDYKETFIKAKIEKAKQIKKAWEDSGDEDGITNATLNSDYSSLTDGYFKN